MESPYATSPVSVAEMTPLVQNMLFSGNQNFSSIRMSTCLDAPAEACREALMRFVEDQLVTFMGMDEDGVEHWAPTRNGVRVWGGRSLGCRVTQKSVKHFMAYMRIVVATLARMPQVRRVLVGGAWLREASHGPFLIGIDVRSGTMTEATELQLIEEVLQIATDGDGLDDNAPVVMVFCGDEEAVPQSLQFSKVAYEHDQGVTEDLKEAPPMLSHDSDEADVGWDGRLLVYAALTMSFDPRERAAVLRKARELGRHTSVDIQHPLPGLRLSKQLVEREVRYLAFPPSSEESPWSVIPHLVTADYAPPASYLELCEEFVRIAGKQRGDWFATDWQVAAAAADYFRDKDMLDEFDAKAYAKKLLKGDYTYHARNLHPMLKKSPVLALVALSIALNKQRSEARLSKKERAAARPKKKTVNDYWALFDVTFEEPLCVALVRQPSGHQGNLRTARETYALGMVINNPDARAAQRSGFIVGQVALVKRPATSAEISEFERVSKQLKRAVAFIIELRGDSLIGFSGREVKPGNSPMSFRALPQGNLVPIELSRDDFQHFEDHKHAMSASFYERMRSWWVIPDITPAADAAQACVDGPNLSRLARVIDTERYWTFQRMDTVDPLYSASFIGTGWAVRLENIGSRTTPPMVVYQLGNEEDRAQLQWNSYLASHNRNFSGVMTELQFLLAAFRLVEDLGLEEARSLLRSKERETVGGDGADHAMRVFEQVLNMAVTASIFWRSYRDWGHFVRFGASFGTEAMKAAFLH